MSAAEVIRLIREERLPLPWVVDAQSSKGQGLLLPSS